MEPPRTPLLNTSPAPVRIVCVHPRPPSACPRGWGSRSPARRRPWTQPSGCGRLRAASSFAQGRQPWTP
ncbi:hypothetical protein K438DRAFT_1815030 [Mycena galopus ATCC 62051]|nr:hypothetical protein K438DRAFT_1815030 [Mycena galopus ATCC 62051]